MDNSGSNSFQNNNDTTNDTTNNSNSNNNSRSSAPRGRPTVDLNLPIPNSRAKAAIVKLYDLPSSSEIKLTDMLELVGVVSLDPALAHLAGQEEEEMMGGSTAPHLPPPSLVPRLHVVSYTKLSHNNPLGTRQRSNIMEKGQLFIRISPAAFLVYFIVV